MNLVMRLGHDEIARVRQGRPLGGLSFYGGSMDKPFKTIGEQARILESRGVSTDSHTASVLEREGYYSVVNGYKDLFLDRDATKRAGTDVYAEGTSFSDIYRLFTFDRELRLTMFRYFAEAEATLKTVCAYKISEARQDETEPYLNPANYRQDRRYRLLVLEFINDLKKILHRHPYEDGGFKRDYIEHYALFHDGVPLWVLTNFLMLGQAFKLYDFQPESMKNAIARRFSDLYEETHRNRKRIGTRRLRLAYDHIKDFRNICAHDERLYCARVSPSSDISFGALLDDLELVLTREEHVRMLRDVTLLVTELVSDLDARHAQMVTEAMGINGIGTPIASTKVAQQGEPTPSGAAIGATR